MCCADQRLKGRISDSPRALDPGAWAGFNRGVHTLDELAALVGGTVSGDGTTPIRSGAPFEQAGDGDITLATGRFLDVLYQTDASALIVPTGTEQRDRNLLLVEMPKVAFARILQLFVEQPFRAEGISDRACIGRDCRISENVTIGPFVSIGDNAIVEDGVSLGPGVVIGADARIGEGSTLHANVGIYRGVTIGKRVIIHSGTVIGSDGFGYVFDGSAQVKIPQTGTVQIGDDVEIGANCCIDRATFGSTILERHVKLDNLVHVAHNCRIGENTVIVGCCGISGSVEIGRNCVLAGQVGVADHVRVGDNVKILAKASVFKDVPSGSVVSGTPARDHRQELRAQAALRRLPDLLRLWRRDRSGGH